MAKALLSSSCSCISSTSSIGGGTLNFFLFQLDRTLSSISKGQLLLLLFSSPPPSASSPSPSPSSYCHYHRFASSKISTKTDQASRRHHHLRHYHLSRDCINSRHSLSSEQGGGCFSRSQLPRRPSICGTINSTSVDYTTNKRLHTTVTVSMSSDTTTNQPPNDTNKPDGLNMDSMSNGLASVANGKSEHNDPMRPKDIQIPVPFGHIAAQAWGNPLAKTKILALHGWLDNSGSFDNLIPNLIDTEDYYIVAYDDVGTGLSSHLPHGMLYDRALLTVTLRRVIKYLGWKKYILMGHSLGGLNSTTYACIYPNEVTRIISIDIIMPPVFNAESWQGKAKSYIEDGINYEVDRIAYTKEEAIKRIVEGHMKSLSLDNANTLMKRGTRKVVTPGQRPKYIFNRDVRIRTLFMEFLTDQQYLEIYKNLRCHLLILRSTMVDHSQMGQLGPFYKCFKEVTASFKEELISGTHHIHLGNPDDCADTIKEWMAQIDELDKKSLGKK